MSTSKELAAVYWDGLAAAYRRENCGELWAHFASIVHGASEVDLGALACLYPDVPESLLELLRLADGTYWREYQGEKVGFYLLGSDIEEYPYYLLSARQMIETKDEFKKWGGYLIRRESDNVRVDEEVCGDMEKLDLLHFSDCMNNGGTSQLFIDFSPSAKGKRGQVLRFVHDPDELSVIADSFDEYLQGLMEYGYDFINEDTMEE